MSVIQDQKQATIAKEFFDNPFYAEKDAVYITSDNRPFLSVEAANPHRQTLADKKLSTYQREKVLAEVELDEKKSKSKSDPALVAAKAAYKELTGKSAHHTWDVGKIAEKTEEFITAEAEKDTSDTPDEGE